MPSATSETVRELSALARESGLKVLVLPPVRELFNGHPTASDLRNLDVADLLGRQPVHLDMAAIADQIGGKRVLVTGAGGSIGSELCRQISKFGPSHLLMLDRDESGLHATQLSIEGRSTLDSDDILLCDIRDVEALQAAFERTRPQIVFHAAALKHLTMLEHHPSEAFKTNVVGTRNVLEAAHAVGVETFVNISTDKAARPTCVLGWSKRVAERLTASFNGDGGHYVSVRFGNVLGSRGSVVPAFLEMISRGGPVTVTHPDVERFFMLIPEACQLVLQAGAMGGGGEVMVLDMGSPVKIVEVARTLIDLSGRTDIEIVYTGLNPGEKLTEELFTPGEEIERSAHPLISQVYVPALEPRHVELHEGAVRGRDPRVDAPARGRLALERRLMSAVVTAMQTVLVAAVVTCAACYPVLHLLRRAGGLDVPNARSSHAVPTPRGGGLALLAGVAAAALVRLVAGPRMVDGRCGWPSWHQRRLPCSAWPMTYLASPRSHACSRRQSIGVATGLALGGWQGALLGAMVVPAAVNMVNFMDGINGICAGHAVVWGGACADRLVVRRRRCPGRAWCALAWVRTWIPAVERAAGTTLPRRHRQLPHWWARWDRGTCGRRGAARSGRNIISLAAGRAGVRAVSSLCAGHLVCIGQEGCPW